MKELIMIYNVLKQRANEEAEEMQFCMNNNLGYAAQYASGKTAAYTHAMNLLRTYIEAELPFEDNIAKEIEHD